jgi:putative membrane protein
MTTNATMAGSESVVAGLVTMLLAAALAMTAAGYGRGVHELWYRRGRGAVVPGWRVVAFAAGLIATLATQSGPVATLAGSGFAGHMTQHMLLLLVAGPLLAAGAAGLPLTLACPASLRRWLARVRATTAMRRVRRPGCTALLAGGAQALALWFWHLPTPYLAAARHPVLHVAEHVCFLGASWLLWAPILGPARHRLPILTGTVLLLATMLQASALGAVLVFAPRPVYPAEVYGTDPLADQQLAGLLMWAPMDLLVLVATLTAVARWLVGLRRRRPERVTSPEAGDLLPAATGRVGR